MVVRSAVVLMTVSLASSLAIAAPCNDNDGDGYGDPGHVQCLAGPEDDCNDADPAVYPGATELCNGVDDDCDVEIDEDGPDTDYDDVVDCQDNCPNTPNTSQIDVDSDGVGDQCDNCYTDPNPAQSDLDADGLGDICDNCPTAANVDQSDGDADWVGDICDNCPVDPNSGQEDADNDGVGDACDPCDNDDDPDLDTVCSLDDNCPAIYNLSQSDIDADGLGDACDDCPQETGPGVDADGDGICDSADGCPGLFDPQQRRLKLNGPLTPGGGVESYAVSDDGLRVVYRADAETLDLVELYSVSITGGAPVKLNGALAPGTFVRSFDISPDGATVVFRAAHVDDPHEPDLFAVPIDGGLPIELSDGLRFVSQELISPDGEWVAFGAFNFSPCLIFDVHMINTVPIDGSLAPIGHDHCLPGFASTSFVVSREFTSDSERVVHVVNDDGPGRDFLFSGAVSTPDTLSTEFGTFGFEISADGTTMVYENGSVFENNGTLRSQSASGGTEQLLSTGDVDEWAVSPAIVNGSYRTVYLDLGPGELRSQPIEGGAAITLDTAGQRPVFAGSGDLVVYRRIEDRLFSVDTLGGTPTMLSDSTLAGAEVIEHRITPDDQTTVYLGDMETDETYELYGVPVGGGATAKLNPTLVAGGNVETDFVTGNLESTVVYRADQLTDEIRELFSVPATGGNVRKLNSELPATSEVLDHAVTPDDRYVLYRAAEETPGVIELYRVPFGVDGDGDGTFDSCDCSAGDSGLWSSPGLVRDLVLSQAGETTTLSWISPADPGGSSVVFDTLRTDASDAFMAGSAAAIDCIETDNGSDNTATDTDFPPFVYFYLVRAGNGCAEGELGAARDRILTCP